MTTDQDVDNFLEHFGVRGQKWGVRKPKSARTETQKSHAARNRKLKAAGGILGAVAVIAGGLYAKKILNQNSTRRVSELRQTPEFAEAARNFFEGKRRTQMSHLTKARENSSITTNQFDRLSNLMGYQQENRIRNAVGSYVR